MQYHRKLESKIVTKSILATLIWAQKYWFFCVLAILSTNCVKVQFENPRVVPYIYRWRQQPSWFQVGTLAYLHKNKYIFSARSQILIIDENFWGYLFIFFVQEDQGVRTPTGCQLSCVAVRRWGQQRVGNL